MIFIYIEYISVLTTNLYVEAAIILSQNWGQMLNFLMDLTRQCKNTRRLKL